MKLCFIGSEGAGKTTLKESMKRKLNFFEKILFGSKENIPDDPQCEMERTVGITVSVKVDIPGVGLFSLFDYAGQKHFHKTHGLFFSSSNSIFILVLSLVRGEKKIPRTIQELLEDAEYWLSFLQACFKSGCEPTVLIVASRLDRYRDGQRILAIVTRSLCQLFAGRIRIGETCFALDCRKCGSDEMKQLKDCLAAIRAQNEQVSHLR